MLHSTTTLSRPLPRGGHNLTIGAEALNSSFAVHIVGGKNKASQIPTCHYRRGIDDKLVPFSIAIVATEKTVSGTHRYDIGILGLWSTAVRKALIRTINWIICVFTSLRSNYWVLKRRKVTFMSAIMEVKWSHSIVPSSVLVLAEEGV